MRYRQYKHNILNPGSVASYDLEPPAWKRSGTTLVEKKGRDGQKKMCKVNEKKMEK